MKQVKRLTAMALALMCVMSCVLVPASATDHLSDYAGTTMKCRVVTSTSAFDVDVAIPAGATKEQESALVQAAALSAAGPSTRSARAVMDTISTQSKLEIMSNFDHQVVGGGKLPSKFYKTFIIQFDGITRWEGASSLSVTVTCSDDPGSKTIDSGNLGSSNVVMYMVNGDKVTLLQNQTMTVTAIANKGYIKAETCKVSASIYELNA